MAGFDQELNGRLEALRSQGLLRELRVVDSPQTTRIQVDGRSVLNFASNDYLGLATETELKEAAARAIDRFGAGAGASRLTCGTQRPHVELEETLAAFKDTEEAITFSSGYAAALGTIGSLVGKNDIIVLDKLVHACIIDAARLCGAKLRIFAHNDPNELEDILKWASTRRAKARILIATESVFSMDGDHAPLRQFVELKDKYGAWLMVDEAHATGLYGPNRRGLADELGLADRIEVQMGTLSKAVGASGGFVCGSGALVRVLLNCARTFIFSTAPVPAAAAAATAGIRLIQSVTGEQRRNALWQRVDEFYSSSTIVPRPKKVSAIIPILIGHENRAIRASAELRDQGFFIPAVRYPSVPRGKARLRLSITASHSSQEIELARTALGSLAKGPSEPSDTSHATVG